MPAAQMPQPTRPDTAELHHLSCKGERKREWNAMPATIRAVLTMFDDAPTSGVIHGSPLPSTPRDILSHDVTAIRLRSHEPSNILQLCVLLLLSFFSSLSLSFLFLA